MLTQQQAVNLVLRRLRGALGTGEVPDGSNHNFITEWYNKNVAKIGNGPWCQMTVTWSTWTAHPDFKKLLKGQAYTVWAAQDGQKGVNGSTWHWGTKGMKAGDHVYYNWTGEKGPNAIQKIDHVSTAEKINGNGTFYSLEGNIGNKLRRVLRDGKYVVGYVRPNWSLVSEPNRPKPAPQQPKPSSAHPMEKDRVIKPLQRLLGVNADGVWGPVTDARAQLMRAACRTHLGWPKSSPSSFNVEKAQSLLGVKVDNTWGVHSESALYHWLKNFQHIVGANNDGAWGPKTEARYQELRDRYHTG